MPEQDTPRAPMTAEEIEAATVGAAPKLNGRITLREYDPRWPEAFARQAARMRAALGGLAHGVEHVGSTSVPGLPAKPIIDMLLTVPDSGAEPDYLPALEGLGFTLAIREPEWYEHRVLRKRLTAADDGADSVNLHVLSAGCPEADRMLLFRDHLRAHEDDRALYAATKRALSERTWEYVQNYADAKSDVVAAILQRAAGGGR
ncbi:GrpB family protein [Streptomyces sp. G45]|uniref:GrpB family protein n=1 Tax=Streptomyces sp. G45 TaxID=3406627 RepID=UPI003C2106E8